MLSITKGAQVFVSPAIINSAIGSGCIVIVVLKESRHPWEVVPYSVIS